MSSDRSVSASPDPSVSTGQAPLPEGRWLFRRLYACGLTIGALALVAVIAVRAPASALLAMSQGLMLLIGFVALLYLVAPSAPQIIALLGRRP